MIRHMNKEIFNNITIFIKKRVIETLGLLSISFALALLIALSTYSPEDPTLIFNDNELKIDNFFGFYGSVIADFLLQSFGIVCFLMPITFLSWGINLISKKLIDNIIFKISGITFYLIVGSSISYINFNNSFWLINNGNSGFVGKIIFDNLGDLMNLINLNIFNIFLISLLILSFIYSSNIKVLILIKKTFNLFKRGESTINQTTENIQEVLKENISDKFDQKSFSFESKKAESESSLKREFKLPPTDLLKDFKKNIKNEKNLNKIDPSFIEKILLDYGVEGSIKKINNGPVVNLYEFEPAPGVKVSKIINLSEDLARSTSSTSARVSVIPGKNTVGIEIPNENREEVTIKELILNEKFRRREIKLPIALGKDISGNPIVADLTSMPHLLIAGTTGSGKSVCINTLIISLLYRLTPELCKFILIDPKMLELSAYQNIPHLLTPVITDSKKATAALGWAVKEMNSRYKLMSKVGVKNIDGYNQKHSLKMPYIVLIVDEMSDLMLVAGKEIENYVQKLSQMARAAGIHIIMATQRPSVDVITGTIKANFPTRASFQVSSKIDSRTILGEQGAEQLLGKGDMLFMSSANRIIRIHGPYVSEKEIENISSVLRGQGQPDYIEEIIYDTANQSNDTGENLNEIDELYNQALDLIKREGKASTSFLQRKLQIGYNRAARIIDMMEEKGIVSKANHVGKREVL